jgi:hypothetical protein
VAPLLRGAFKRERVGRMTLPERGDRLTLPGRDGAGKAILAA